MTKFTWQVINTTQANLDITQYVRSLTYTMGRSTPLSTYSGNQAVITMSSYGGIENYVNVNDELRIKARVAGPSYTTLFIGYIASRNFNDNPGTGVNSTMTVMINDNMLQAGMANFNNQALASTNFQLQEIDALLPQIGLSAASDPTLASMSVGTFTTNANQRINEIIAGDRGILSSLANLRYINPSNFFDVVYNNLTIGPSTSASQIAYQDLVRVEAASNSLFYTQATVTGSTSTQTKSSEALTTYGTRTFTASTAQSNLVADTAEWYANTFTDPEISMLNLSFSDLAQNATALNLFLGWVVLPQFLATSYTPPGGVSTTGYYWPEQITVNATVDQTIFNFSMSPQTYYANFILNDAVFGVLDTDRLGV